MQSPELIYYYFNHFHHNPDDFNSTEEHIIHRLRHRNVCQTSTAKIIFKALEEHHEMCLLNSLTNKMQWKLNANLWHRKNLLKFQNFINSSYI